MLIKHLVRSILEEKTIYKTLGFLGGEPQAKDEIDISNFVVACPPPENEYYHDEQSSELWRTIDLPHIMAIVWAIRNGHCLAIENDLPAGVPFDDWSNNPALVGRTPRNRTPPRKLTGTSKE